LLTADSLLRHQGHNPVHTVRPKSLGRGQHVVRSLVTVGKAGAAGRKGHSGKAGALWPNLVPKVLPGIDR
jgi:hypothetical protein